MDTGTTFKQKGPSCKKKEKLTLHKHLTNIYLCWKFALLPWSISGHFKRFQLNDLSCQLTKLANIFLWTASQFTLWCSKHTLPNRPVLCFISLMFFMGSEIVAIDRVLIITRGYFYKKIITENVSHCIATFVLFVAITMTISNVLKENWPNHGSRVILDTQFMTGISFIVISIVSYMYLFHYVRA